MAEYDYWYRHSWVYLFLGWAGLCLFGMGIIALVRLFRVITAMKAAEMVKELFDVGREGEKK
jgi:hypothetical protein